MFSLTDVVTAYQTWLEKNAAKHAQPFRARLSTDLEAAQAEAVVFGFLWQLNLAPRPTEDLSSGGADFTCTMADGNGLVVEVTSLSRATVTSITGWPDGDFKGAGRGYSQLTTKLFGKAIEKARQLANQPSPRILAIVTSHQHAHFVFGTRGAEELLTGTTSLSPPEAPDSRISVITELKNSVFFRPSHVDDKIEPARQSISAILLLALSDESVSVVGVLHPCPAERLNHEAFSDIHFVRLKAWPIDAQKPFEIEWVGMRPGVRRLAHAPFFDLV